MKRVRNPNGSLKRVPISITQRIKMWACKHPTEVCVQTENHTIWVCKRCGAVIMGHEMAWG